MRDIRALMAQLPENRQSNFGLAAYQDEKGESRAMCRMTQDGFTWLAMRFRGKKTLAFQIVYTDAFNGYVNQSTADSYRSSHSASFARGKTWQRNSSQKLVKQTSQAN